MRLASAFLHWIRRHGKRTMTRKFVPRAGLLGVLALLSSCQGILGIEDWSPRSSTDACLRNSDCSGGKVCLFALCSKPCSLDSDCLPGSRCLKTDTEAGTACVRPGQASCTDQCVAGATCASGECRTSCAGATDCRQDQSCVASVCIGTDPAHDPAAGADSGAQGAGGAANDAASGQGGSDASPDAPFDGAGSTEAGSDGSSGGAGSGGAPSSGGTAGASSSGGASSGGGAGGGGAGTGGASGGCPGGCADPTPVCDAPTNTCVECTTGQKRCAPADVPETCVNGFWSAGSACGAGTVCSNGACATLRVTGGLLSLAAPTGGAVGSYKLLDQSLEFTAAKSCNLVNGQTLCVTGGIQP